MKKIVLLFILIIYNFQAFSKDPCGPSISCFVDKDIEAPFGCEYLVTPEDLLTEGTCPGENYIIEVYGTFDDTGFSDPIDNPVPYEFFATTIYASITRESDGNSCWSEIDIRNAIPPFVVAFALLETISCQDGLEAIDPPEAIDFCDEDNELTVDFISSDFVCRTGTNDAVDLTYLISDSRGQTKESTFRLEYTDFCVFADLPEDILVSCPEDIPDPIISVDDIGCGRTITINVSEISIFGSCDVTRLYIFDDLVAGLRYIHEQQIAVDNTPPSLVLNPQSTITYNEFEEDAFDPYLEVFDNCGFTPPFESIEFLTPTDCNNRDFMVRYHISVFDDCGNETTRFKDVTVERIGNATVRINGRKDCGDDFLITADPNNLVPPVTYLWTSSNPAWVVTPNLSNNTALVSPAPGSTTISVVATDALGCEYNDTKRYNCGRGNIRGRSIASIEIGPNPFQDLLQIKNLTDNSKIILHNLQGKMVLQDSNKNGSDWSKNLDYLPEGVYLLNILTEKEEKMMKIVKVN
jgi:hypothetical protein